MNRSTTLSAALAALFLLPVLAGTARAQQTLSPALIAPDITLAEIASRHSLSANERAQVIAIDQALFRRAPAWTLKTLRGEVTDVKNARHMDPVRLADWRKQSIVNACFNHDPHLMPAEIKTMLDIYTRTNPIIVADTTSKTVVCERDIDAWVAASQMMAQQSGTPVVGDLHAELISYVRNAESDGEPWLIAANMERDWTAFQLGFSHEPLSDQRSLMKDMKKGIQVGGTHPPSPPRGTRSVAICALTIANFVYKDYPPCLSPKFASEKGPMILAIMRAGRQRWETLHALNGYVPGNP